MIARLALLPALFCGPISPAPAAVAPAASVDAVPFIGAAAPAVRALDIEVPRNDGWVTDLAGLISPAKEAELEALMESYRQGTTHEIAVLTVPSLKGEPIERFALEVGRAWGMGTKEKNNAALLVISKEDRKIRIEVARGLEGSLTDSISGRIIRDVIAPKFKQGRFEEGIEAGVRAIHAAIGGDYGRIPRGAAPVAVGLLGCLIPALFFLIVLVILIRVSRRAARGMRGPRGRRSPMPWFIPFPTGGGSRSSGGGRSGGFGGFGGGGGFSGGGASGGW